VSGDLGFLLLQRNFFEIQTNPKSNITKPKSRILPGLGVTTLATLFYFEPNLSYE